MNPILSSNSARSDPLSDLLALLDVQSFISRRIEAFGPWALRFPTYRHMKFGSVIKGTRWIWIEGGDAPLRLEAGDFYLLCDGAPYCFASNPAAVPMDGLAVTEEYLEADGVVRFGHGDQRSVGIGGRFVLDDETGSLLLAMLPPIIHIRGSVPEAGPLRAALTLLSFETEAQRPGSSVLGDSLCAIVLVNILRLHLADAEQPHGWLGALNDRHIGQALQQMHGNIAQRWKVEDLAAEVGMSRAAFAERFKRLVGMAPLEYLIDWRMLVARKVLTQKPGPLAAVAQAIGYESETAFSLAFKRRFGESPGRYRSRLQQAASEELTGPEAGF
jgi:AraC-like DNA-binding protein